MRLHCCSRCPLDTPCTCRCCSPRAPSCMCPPDTQRTPARRPRPCGPTCQAGSARTLRRCQPLSRCCSCRRDTACTSAIRTRDRMFQQGTVRTRTPKRHPKRCGACQAGRSRTSWTHWRWSTSQLGTACTQRPASKAQKRCHESPGGTVRMLGSRAQLSTSRADMGCKIAANGSQWQGCECRRRIQDRRGKNWTMSTRRRCQRGRESRTLWSRWPGGRHTSPAGTMYTHRLRESGVKT